MSKAKTQTAPNADKFDYSAYLPEGVELTDVYKTGGLTPIFSPEQAFTEELVVAGWIDRIFSLPTQRENKEDEYTPYMIMLREIHTDTMGTQKDTQGNNAPIEVKKGKDILIPITGNLKTNRELITAVMDPTQSHFGIFRVVGTMKLDQPTPMWVWDCRLVTKTRPRAGVFAAPGILDPTRLFAKNKEGQTFNTDTGEVIDSDGKTVSKLVEKRA